MSNKSLHIEKPNNDTKASILIRFTVFVTLCKFADQRINSFKDSYPPPPPKGDKQAPPKHQFRSQNIHNQFKIVQRKTCISSVKSEDMPLF